VTSSALSSAEFAVDLADSRAFSLRNFGAFKPALMERLVARVSSTWLRRVERVLRPYSPNSVAFSPLRCWESSFGGGAPTSDNKSGHADARTSR
jgi:hypothetical protein